MAGDWKWTEVAVQAIGFWLGYQRKRFRHCPIREIAVVTEWAVLLHTPAQRQGMRIECERTFPLVLDVPPESIPDYRQKRVDIAIGDKDSLTRYAIEVKVLDKITCADNQTWVNDLGRLAWLREKNRDRDPACPGYGVYPALRIVKQLGSSHPCRANAG